uniref:NADH-ubiquinone oxidoreductase chain 5 n=1 Tax=Microceramus pontificus TaxID=513540 RepID=A0A343F257_9EUPU|nr:NADH dehydrogenase subunit 5 [Microceramus pontificus]ASP44427.1 NADH dehydrogenase subunit 5 [Microceramus pontificus]
MMRMVVLLFPMMFLFMMLMYSFLLTSNMSVFVDLHLFFHNSFTMNYTFIFDFVSSSFATVVCLISFSVFWFANEYMSEDKDNYRFIWMLFLFVLSMLALIFSQSLFSLLVGWDGLGITSFILIIYYENNNSLWSGFLTLMINRLGDVIIMSSLFLLLYKGSTMLYIPYLNYSAQLLLVFYMIAALTKSAQYPFSAWLPAAMAAPTPVSALVHSSTLVTAGIYLIIRLLINLPIVPDNSMLLMLGSMTCLLGGICAMGEYDIKKLIALSTLSQLGVMMFSIGLGMISLSLFHLYSHAMFKALLFIVAGHILMLTYGVQDLRQVGGVLKGYPILSSVFMVTSFCLMGMPFMTGYFSKHLLMELCMISNVNMFSVLVMVVSAMISAAYMTRFMKILIFSPSFPSILSSHKVKSSSYIPMVILFLMSIQFGEIFLMMDYNHWESPILSKFLSLTVFLLMFLGIMMGLLWKINNSLVRWCLMSMFFLNPSSKQVINMITKSSNCMVVLDSGWLEPYSFLKKSNIYLMKHINLNFIWPMSSFNFMQNLLVFIITILWILYIY